MRRRIAWMLVAAAAAAGLVMALVWVLAGGGGGDAKRRDSQAASAARRTKNVAFRLMRPRVRTRPAVRLPAGSLRVARSRIPAGTSDAALHLKIGLSRAPRGGRLELRLPRRFVGRSVTGLAFAGAPTLDSSSPRGVALTRTGTRLTLDLRSARKGDKVGITVPRLALPAGRYKLPVLWHDASGTRALGAVTVAILAGTKDPVGHEKDASSDSDEESETFDVVAPNDPNRIVTSANDVDDATGRKGVFLSSDGGQTFKGLLFPTQLDVPSSSTNESASLGGDPILAADTAGDVWAGGLTRCNTGAPSRIFLARIPAGSAAFASKGVGLPLLHSGGTCTAATEDTTAIQDKPQMTIDNWSGSPTFGRLYVTWDDPATNTGVDEVISFCDTHVGPATDAARCDNADNWSTPTVISGGPGSYITSDPAVAPDGKVYVVWWDYSAANAIMVTSCASSCDTAASWSTPDALASLDKTGGKPVPFACPIVAQPGGRASPVPSIAFAPDARAYVAWSDLRAGSGATRCADTKPPTPPSVTHQTWDSFVATAPQLSDLLSGPASSRTSATQGKSIIGDSSTSSTSASNSDDWFPWVAVDRSSGQAWVDVMSTTGDSTRRTTHPYASAVTPPASGTVPTLAAPTRLSATASDYSASPCCTFGNDYGDYTGLSVVNGFPYAIWTRHAGATDDGDELVYVPGSAPNPTTTPTTPTTPPGQTTQPSSTPTTPAPPAPATPTSPGLGVSVPRQRRSVVARRGLLVRAGCKSRCRLTLTVVTRTRKGKRTVRRTLVRRTVTITGARSLRLRLSKSARARLAATPTSRLRLLASASDSANHRQTAVRAVRLVR